MTVKSAGIVFPNQLFEQIPYSRNCEIIYLIEENLFFRQYPFHKRKIAFHRASMKFYETYLKSNGYSVNYIDSYSQLSDIRELIAHLKQKAFQQIEYIEPVDNWLEKRIIKTSGDVDISRLVYDTQMFLNTKDDIRNYFSGKKVYRQTDFYIRQRKKREILIENNKPAGGKWTYDSENRLKYPKGKTPPKIKFPELNEYYRGAIEYTEKHFPGNHGKLNHFWIYPSTFEESKAWLNRFLNSRLFDFGLYEDAMVLEGNILNHSVLTPMLNVGLLTPGQVLEETLLYSTNHEIPINSLEGFIRQILGWREFIRGIYETRGTEQRNRNYWNFDRKIPSSFWNGSTGIKPLDTIINKVLETAYCHHIERLMILGNFMLLCEFDPDEVYQWFMGLFIDAYDWVMVPNVYGMSQFADGGFMASKPYISGSNYLMRMSDFSKGDWQVTWDALFWRFLNVHRDFLIQNPRLKMLISNYDRMDQNKKMNQMAVAEKFLTGLT